MFGFLIGTACLIGLIATLRRGGACGGYAYSGGGCGGRRWGHHHHGHHHGGGFGSYREESHEEHRHEHTRGRRGWRGGWGPRAWVSMLSHRLDLTPAQEKVVSKAFGEVRDAIKKGRGEFSDTRKDVARAFRAGSFDAVIMGETFSRHDNSIDEVRKAVTGALANIHEALDEKQREKLAEILEEGWW
jgi:hypothetical protein